MAMVTAIAWAYDSYKALPWFAALLYGIKPVVIAIIVQAVEHMAEYDLYDVLAELGYGLAPRTRAERAEAFTYKHSGWLDVIPRRAAATIRALAGQRRLLDQG